MIDEEDFVKQVNDCGLAIIGQSGHLDPADKKMYALRDVTRHCFLYSINCLFYHVKKTGSRQ